MVWPLRMRSDIVRTEFCFINCARQNNVRAKINRWGWCVERVVERSVMRWSDVRFWGGKEGGVGRVASFLSIEPCVRWTSSPYRGAAGTTPTTGPQDGSRSIETIYAQYPETHTRARPRTHTQTHTNTHTHALINHTTLPNFVFIIFLFEYL